MSLSLGASQRRFSWRLFPSNRRFFKEIATYQAWICMVMNDTEELMQSTTTKTRKSKKGKGLKPERFAHLFLLPSKD